MFPWWKEWQQHCLGMFLVCRWCPVGMPRMAQGTRWGFNSCLQSPPALLSPGPFSVHVQFPVFTDKAPQHAENAATSASLGPLWPVTCTRPGRHLATIPWSWNGNEKRTPTVGAPTHQKTGTSSIRLERPRRQPGGNPVPTRKHLGSLNVHELFQSLSKHFNCLGGSFKREKPQHMSYKFQSK